MKWNRNITRGITKVQISQHNEHACLQWSSASVAGSCDSVDHMDQRSTSISSAALINAQIQVTIKLICCVHVSLYSLSQKNPPPPEVFLHFFPNGWEFLVQILHTYYTFQFTLDYKFLLNYLQLRRSYAILSATTQFTSYAQNVHLGWNVCWMVSYHNFVTDGDNWTKICSPVCVKLGLKIPNRLGNMSENLNDKRFSDRETST